MLNQESLDLFRHTHEYAESFSVRTTKVGGATVIDMGIDQPGSIDAGIVLARLCLGDQAEVALVPIDADRFTVDNGIFVRTDAPVAACLGSQYAGWPVKTDDFFAMGSGPMRLVRGREPMLIDLGLAEQTDQIVGVLESDKLPSKAAVQMIAADCGVAAKDVFLAVAPTSSMAGSVQVVARSIETALHKLHELKFDVNSVVSATGLSPLSPPAKPGDGVTGIGRTNDAMLYGAQVTLWVQCDDADIQAVIDNVPSGSSKDHGRPFAQIFKDYQYDFYRVDPMLFSPAKVTMHNLTSGRSFTAGRIDTDVLRASFYG